MKNKVNNRNSAIELLRIVAMMGVVILHYNNKEIGGGFSYVQEFSANYMLLYFVEAVAISAVDIYILITGYFLSDRQKRSLYRPFELLFQVCFFKVVLYLIDSYINNAFSVKTLVACLIPNNYFVILYCTLYLISPLLNRAFSSLSLEKMKKAVILLLFLFSVWPIGADLLNEIMQKEYFGLSTIGMYGSQSGYTIVIFVLMYCIGAYLRRITPQLPSKTKCLFSFGILAFIEFVWSIVERNFYQEYYTAWHYDNPVVIGMAVSIFCFFVQFRIQQKWINKLATAGFVCFLIHQPILKYIGIEHAVQQNSIILLMHMIFWVICIYILSFCVCLIYNYLIQRILHKISRIFPTIEF